MVASVSSVSPRSKFNVSGALCSIRPANAYLSFRTGCFSCVPETVRLIAGRSSALGMETDSERTGFGRGSLRGARGNNDSGQTSKVGSGAGLRLTLAALAAGTLSGSSAGTLDTSRLRSSRQARTVSASASAVGSATLKVPRARVKKPANTAQPTNAASAVLTGARRERGLRFPHATRQA